MAGEAGAGSRNALSAIRSRVPVYRSAAPSSMEAGCASRTGFSVKGPPDLEMLGVRRGNVRAIAPTHQHAILGLAQIRDAHGKPYSDRSQRDGKSEGRNVRQHAMTKIVRFIPVPRIARQVVLLLSLLVLSLIAQFLPLTRRVNQGAWPEFEHTVLFFRRNGPLGFHWSQLRNILILFSTLATRLTENVDMARMRESIPQRSDGTCRSLF
jgi:hypothetical protein